MNWCAGLNKLSIVGVCGTRGSRIKHMFGLLSLINLDCQSANRRSMVSADYSSEAHNIALGTLQNVADVDRGHDNDHREARTGLSADRRC